MRQEMQTYEVKSVTHTRTLNRQIVYNVHCTHHNTTHTTQVGRHSHIVFTKELYFIDTLYIKDTHNEQCHCIRLFIYLPGQV